MSSLRPEKEVNYTSDAPETIQKLFGSIAPRYDLANSLLSFHLHRIWNQQLVSQLSRNDPVSWIDLCAGTGEIGYLFLKTMPTAREVTFVDFCPEMVSLAKARQVPFQDQNRLSFIQADATSLPFEASSFDVASMAYGLRNIENKEKALSEVLRVLKPKGLFGILDLTAPKSPILKTLHRFYLKHFIPKMGGLITGDRSAFEYLSKSIERFSSPDLYVDLLQQAGFQKIRKRALLFGTAHLILAEKSP